MSYIEDQRTKVVAFRDAVFRDSGGVFTRASRANLSCMMLC